MRSFNASDSRLSRGALSCQNQEILLQYPKGPIGFAGQRPLALKFVETES